MPALLLASVSFAWAQTDVAPAANKIRLDGVLEAREWGPATRLTLTQAEPKPGAATPFTTEVLLQADSGHLYVAFRCTDPQPGRISTHTLRRDGDFEGDDNVAIVLDTLGDGRTAYQFRVNAAGARQDGLVASANPEEYTTDWNGLWDARTHRSGEGWTAEFVIPARTLTFRPGRPWGANFERFVARERVRLIWSSPTLDSYLTDLSRAGQLSGLGSLAQGRGIELTPYFLGRRLDSFGDRGLNWRGAAGLDYTQRLTPQLTAVLTTNTDFADTEVDFRQLNTTRFPLFFPEKRAFFLEGSNQFQFASGLDSDLIPFFSRRVGLVDGIPTPIDVGGRLLGRVGHWNVGVLSVRTRAAFGLPATTLTASRVTYDLSKEWRIGTLVTNGDPTGQGTNTVAGFDAVYRTSKFLTNKNLIASGWALGSQTRTHGEANTRTGASYGVSVDFPNDRWWGQFRYAEFGRDFDPKLGFLPRPGTRRWQGGVSFSPRPRPGGPVRQFFFDVYGSRVDNRRGYLESGRGYFTPLGVTFESGDEVQVNLIPQREVLVLPFEVTRGAVVPAGGYTFVERNVEASTSRFRPVRGEIRWREGGFYNGTLRNVVASVDFSEPQGRLEVLLATDYNAGRLPQGNFQLRLHRAQLALAVNPNLAITSVFQYDSASDSLGGNTRFLWTVRPGREFITVWNRNWRRVLTRPGLEFDPEGDALIVKLRWTLRF
ncbi:MAG: carbohydrate binding family 9 domain-containing protein [Bryobacteraceae bacterium]|nr:carbohydrate binding family 9 domain-containing protein [Bryobacteraceae bacterium]